MRPGSLFTVLTCSFLLIFSFPRPEAGILVLFAFLPILSGLSRVNLLRALLTGWGTGILWLYFSYNWITHSLSIYGGIPVIYAQGAIALMAGIHGFYFALFSMLIPVVLSLKGREYPEGKDLFMWVRFRARQFAPVLVLPSAWVILEVLRCWFPAPFPWLLLGTAARKIPFANNLYEVGGVYAVSWWIVGINVLAFATITSRQTDRRWQGLILTVFLILPVIITPLQVKTGDSVLRVGVVQGNFPQEVKWDETLHNEIIGTYLTMTESAAREGAKVVVWPETAVTSYYQADPDLIERLRRFTSSWEIHLVFGSPGYEIMGRELLLYNRVYHLPPEGMEEYYNKNILVPFGEYVPFAELLPFIDKMVPGEGEFARGAWDGPFKTPVPSGALVCYEITFPGLVRREVSGGSHMLVNVTNDAWFGRTWGPYQHLAVSTVRAMENRVPVLRAANTGISAIIDSRGRIVKSIPLQQRGFITADINTGGRQTLYTRYGDWIVIFSIVVISVYFPVILNAWRSRKWTS